MSNNSFHRPIALTVAAFDGSSGAGCTADIKTMEQLGVYALAVCSGVSVQHESTFESIQWMPMDLILAQIDLLCAKYTVQVCKIGLIQNKSVLVQVIRRLRLHHADIYILVDPIFSASAGFDFHDAASWAKDKAWLYEIDLLTPNANELQQFSLEAHKSKTQLAKELAQYCAILYKGGHNTDSPGTDYLFHGDQLHTLKPSSTLIAHEKHGSGCVLSAAIAAQLAHGQPLLDACILAKNYISQFLNSTTALLGYHNQQNK